jgi:hypothetical protein
MSSAKPWRADIEDVYRSDLDCMLENKNHGLSGDFQMIDDYAMSGSCPRRGTTRVSNKQMREIGGKAQGKWHEVRCISMRAKPLNIEVLSQSMLAC